jgi:hypothetical protein
MPPTIFSKLVDPRFPSAAIGLESSNATVVHLERQRGGNGFVIRRAATITLPEGLVRPSFDEPNIGDVNTLAGLLSEAATSAGLAKQRRWSMGLPEAAVRAAILTLESAPASRGELEEILSWKYERAFGRSEGGLRVSRERLTPDAQGRPRYLAVATHDAVLAEYEAVFAALGWHAGLVLPRHQGESRWLLNHQGLGDALLVSSHAEGFTAVLLRNRQPAIVRSVMCDPEDRDDEFYRLLLFYRDRLSSAEAASDLQRLLVVGEGFDKERVGQIANETLEISLRPLGPAEVGLAVPSGDFSFDAIAAPAGLAALAWA